MIELLETVISVIDKFKRDEILHLKCVAQCQMVQNYFHNFITSWNRCLFSVTNENSLRKMFNWKALVLIKMLLNEFELLGVQKSTTTAEKYFKNAIHFTWIESKCIECNQSIAATVLNMNHNMRKTCGCYGTKYEKWVNRLNYLRFRPEISNDIFCTALIVFNLLVYMTSITSNAQTTQTHIKIFVLVLVVVWYSVFLKEPHAAVRYSIVCETYRLMPIKCCCASIFAHVPKLCTPATSSKNRN